MDTFDAIHQRRMVRVFATQQVRVQHCFPSLFLFSDNSTDLSVF